MRHVATAAVLMVGLLSFLVEPVPALQPSEAALAATQRWLGGAGRLAAVRALEIAESDKSTLRVLFPDRYQIETTTDTGKMVTSFNGREIFTEFAAGFSPPAPPTALAPAEARRRGLYNMAMYALMYLGRTLPEFPMTVVTRKDTCGNVPGTCLEFQPASGAPLRFVVGADGRPLALVRGLSQPPGSVSVVMLDDYRIVDGIRLPFRVTSKRVSADRSEEVIFTREHRTVLVNPPLAPASFERKAK